MKSRSGIPWPALLCVAVLAALVTACGGGGGKAASTSASTATLKIRDQVAEAKAKAGSQFATATDGQALEVGDTVKTNGTGFAQVNYHDGSLTRLDANAQFTLSDLSTAAQAQRVVGSLDGGRAWSSVEKVTSSEGRYEVDTSVATASVRGTRFSVDCTAADGSCTFTVVDGTVAVTPKGGIEITLQAGESVTVKPDGGFARTPATTRDQLRQDAWIAKNLDIDAAEGAPGASSSSGSTAVPVHVIYTGALSDTSADFSVAPTTTAGFTCRPDTGCSFNGRDGDVPLADGRFHTTIRSDFGAPVICGVPQFDTFTIDLVPVETTKVGGVDVPARMTGTIRQDRGADATCTNGNHTDTVKAAFAVWTFDAQPMEG